MNYFKSLCGKQLQKKHHRAWDLQQKESVWFQLHPRCATHKSAKIKRTMYKFASVFSTNKLFSSTSFKYFYRMYYEHGLRCELGVSVCLLFTVDLLLAASTSAHSCCFMNTFTRSNTPGRFQAVVRLTASLRDTGNKRADVNMHAALSWRRHSTGSSKAFDLQLIESDL